MSRRRKSVVSDEDFIKIHPLSLLHLSFYSFSFPFFPAQFLQFGAKGNGDGGAKQIEWISQSFLLFSCPFFHDVALSYEWIVQKKTNKMTTEKKHIEAMYISLTCV